MTELKNGFSWSKTRDEVFRTCPRQYWFRGHKLIGPLRVQFVKRIPRCIHIYDWKTGKSLSEDLSIQLSRYALYAMEKWKVPPERLYITEFTSSIVRQ